MIKKIAILILLVACSIYFRFIEGNAYEVSLDPLGKVNISGAITGYVLNSNHKFEGDKKRRYEIGSALITITKSPKPIGFNLLAGAYAFPVIGVPISKTSDTTELFSALPIAYLEGSLNKGLSLQVGKLSTLIGYEAAFTYLNNYIQRGLIWNMQPVVHHGARLVYSKEIFSLKVGVNDGFYTLRKKHSKPALEGSLTITPIKDLSFSFNLLLPEKSSRPNLTATPSNKREYNFVASYSLGALTLAGDFIYVEAPKDDKANVVDKAKARGGALHISYAIQPFILSARLEGFKDYGDDGGIDLIGLGDKNKGWSLTISPAYKKGALLVKGEFSYVEADNPFTEEKKKNQSRVGLEVGFQF